MRAGGASSSRRRRRRASSRRSPSRSPAPGSSHLGLPWPGGVRRRPERLRAPRPAPTARCASSAPRTSGTTAPSRSASATPPASLSPPAGASTAGPGRRASASTSAPLEDHSGDGMHTVEARPLGGGDVAACRQGRHRHDAAGGDGRQGRSRAHRRHRRPDALLHGARARRASPWSGPWSTCSTSRSASRERPPPPSGPVTVKWQIPKVGGETLGPGTYWLRVRATRPGRQRHRGARLGRLRASGQGARHHQPAGRRQGGGPHLRRRFGLRLAQPHERAVLARPGGHVVQHRAERGQVPRDRAAGSGPGSDHRQPQLRPPGLQHDLLRRAGEPAETATPTPGGRPAGRSPSRSSGRRTGRRRRPRSRRPATPATATS